jgi:DNA-binding transcriptional ArsR family regulator
VIDDGRKGGIAPDDSGVRGLAAVASCLAEPARARIVCALLGGRAMTATELADEAGVAPSTASEHLAKLRERGLVSLERQGRHRYFRLAGSDVASFVEGLAGFAASRDPARRFGPNDPALRRARVCYDHLAGEFAVELRERLLDRGGLGLDGADSLTAAGECLFADIGVDVADLRRSRRPLVRACLDWSERRHHLGGALGAALLARLFELGWIERATIGRAVTVTPRGERPIASLFMGEPRTWTG